MKRLAALALALLTIFLPTNAAQACCDGGQNPALRFNEAPCLVPSLTGAGPDSSSRWLVLDGSVTQCAPIVVNGGFRIATYKPDESSGRSPSYNARLFDKPDVGEVKAFAAAIAIVAAGDYGVCVLGAGLQRVACGLVTVRITESGVNTELNPLPVGSSLVDKPVVADPYDGTVRPPGGNIGGHCATCF